MTHRNVCDGRTGGGGINLYSFSVRDRAPNIKHATAKLEVLKF